MFLLGNDKDKPVYGALFDVGSGTVGIAIAEFDHSQTLPHIIFSRRFEMRITNQNAKRETLLRKVREAILSSALVLQQEGVKALKSYNKKAKISNVLVTCSSPWSYNLARTVEFKDDEPFKITESIIDDLVHGAEDAILTDLHKKDKKASERYDVVEQASVDISVNDYTVVDPIGLKGTTVSLSHIVGLIPNEITESIREAQEKLFPAANLRTHTYMLIMYCIIRDVFPRLSSLNIVDVTAEAVEFGLVEHGILVENNALHYGAGNLIRDAVELTKRPTSDVIAMLRDYTSKSIDSSPVAPVVEKCIEHYANGIIESMKDEVVPQDVVLTTNRVFEPLFIHILENAFKKATGKKRNILVIDPELLDEITSGSEDDVYLAFEARFFHKLHGCGEIEDK